MAEACTNVSINTDANARIPAQETTHWIQYGITCLPPEDGAAARLLTLRRGHWAIENLAHHTRDMLFGEDASQVRCGSIPQVMCALRNAVISLSRTSGYTEIAYSFRYFAAHPDKHSNSSGEIPKIEWLCHTL